MANQSPMAISPISPSVSDRSRVDNDQLSSLLCFFIYYLVDLKQFPNSKPLLDFKGKPNAVDELVCFQEAQTLPLFLIVPKTKPAFTPMAVKPPFNLVSQAPHSPLASSTQSVSSGSSSSPPTSSNMTRAAFEKLKTQALIDYLIVDGVELEEQDIAAFKKQRISGEALLELSCVDLERAGFPVGLAATIFKRIPKE